MATFTHKISLSIIETRRYIAQASESDSSVFKKLETLQALSQVKSAGRNRCALSSVMGWTNVRAPEAFLILVASPPKIPSKISGIS